MSDLTQDDFLGGKVKLWQPKLGYRAATDPVLLAAATPAKIGMRCLDVGCGVGTASLCLNARIAGLHLYGIEVQKTYSDLSIKNAADNNMDWHVFNSDLTASDGELKKMSFDVILSNPPFFENGSSSPNTAKNIANKFDAADLFDWIDFCLRRLKSGGQFVMINRMEQLTNILVALNGRAGAIEVIPLWSRADDAAKRVVIRAKKDSKTPLKMHSGLLIHSDGQSYTDAAHDVLRNGKAIV